jgi:hypothetical protein
MARAGDGKERSNRRKRQYVLQKRLNVRELAEFVARAHAAGFQDHRDYHAALITGLTGLERRERHDLLRIHGELGKQGSNLNQLTLAVNAGRLTALTAEDLRVIEQARIAVQTAAAQIRGLLA